MAVARELVRPSFPPALFVCSPWPAPEEAPRDLVGLVAWLARAKAAHLDCAWRLGCAGRLVSGAGACLSASVRTPRASGGTIARS